MVRHDKTVALALALQQCAVLLGAPLGVLCSTVWDLHRCLQPLIEKDDLLDVCMLEAAEKELASSPNPAEEVGLPGAEPEFQEEWVTTLHTPNQPEEALKSEEAVNLGVMAIT